MLKRWSLAMWNNRPIDIRVMVQRRNGKPWYITGKAARIAGPGYFVTNIKTSGGVASPVEKAISISNIRSQNTTTLLRHLDHICLKATKLLHRAYPRIQMLGFDMAFDKHGKLWMIEANMRPGTTIFRNLGDKKLYQRIRHLKKVIENERKR